MSDETIRNKDLEEEIHMYWISLISSNISVLTIYHVTVIFKLPCTFSSRKKKEYQQCAEDACMWSNQSLFSSCVHFSIHTTEKKHFKYKLQILMSYTIFFYVQNLLQGKLIIVWNVKMVHTCTHTHTTVCEHADVSDMESWGTHR